jgi:hypothetical protein
LANGNGAGGERVPPGGANAGNAAALARARSYLANVPPAVSGQGGHAQAFAAARAVVWGFDLGAEAGFELLMGEYNPRCLPPWSERELRHKCADADTTAYDKPRGHLLAEVRGANGAVPPAPPPDGGWEPRPCPGCGATPRGCACCAAMTAGRAGTPPPRARRCCGRRRGGVPARRGDGGPQPGAFSQLAGIEGVTLRAPEGQPDDPAVAFVLALAGRANLLREGDYDDDYGPIMLTPGMEPRI